MFHSDVLKMKPVITIKDKKERELVEKEKAFMWPGDSWKKILFRLMVVVRFAVSGCKQGVRVW